ncbi:Rhamnogalacturonate lyase family protein [Melia azedarach]|uniref:Rhamnogalacturonate lyase family protein n=1 Tax=Melia azedarach TaxID=155640 RepID=A0ACC1WR52_MELAZ|nr:Rhamnogalacturonate lyase family protein [Melia azedarach]
MSSLLLLLLSVQWLYLPMSTLGLQLISRDKHVVIDNGILQVTLSKPQGSVTGIQYNGIKNLLEVRNAEANRGYWDVVWSGEGIKRKKGLLDRIDATNFTVITQNEEQVELSFTRMWNSSLEGKASPLKIDKRFHYMAIADNRKRYMPLPDDRLSNRSQVLAYPEAVLLVNPIEPEFRGEVLHSTHYAGAELMLNLGAGESWKKVFGPIFVYLNSLSGGGDFQKLWEDANKQTIREVESWPYNFLASEDFPKSDQRGNISGRLVLQDWYVNGENIPAKGAYVGLAAPGDVGSWQKECKSYQFWTTANEDGYFSIKNIRAGNYNLYAWVPGFIGDYKYADVLAITPGFHADLEDLVYNPPRDGPTLWEIGIPDRSAAEFYVPDPNPKYINKLYVNHPDRFRQYGLWERYAELYPHEDLVYTVDVSDYGKDWFFTQVTRKKDNNTYQGTTWQIQFKLNKTENNGTYKLRLALAAANVAQLLVRINDPLKNPPLFSTEVIGKDNTIARHGIHGLYYLYSVDVPGSLFLEGNNTIFLTQTESISPFQGVMYDYIRLEGPPFSKS